MLIVKQFFDKERKEVCTLKWATGVSYDLLFFSRLGNE
ncbi:hypothetical protein RU86_GL000507 [Lactococcus piscium]|uniref:Uncharacterized protein n=1 Tax=Pseudolactococcus piscium TaxID=1364 RepID=A0A2A5RXP9_9LACT|nr:hypothetical protein RU86_GL000507 [Lactococcus piscium]